MHWALPQKISMQKIKSRNKNGMLIWKVNRLKVTIASVRYRCLFPVRYLKDCGYDSLVIEKTETINFRPGDVEAIIFVKSFTPYDVQLCKKAKEASIPIILDICDNIFIDDYRNPVGHKTADVFQAMAHMASAIVTTGQALSDILKKELDNPPPIYIIPDGNETPDDLGYASTYLNRERPWQLWNYRPLLFLESLTTQAGYTCYKLIQHPYNRIKKEFTVKKIKKKVKALINYPTPISQKIASEQEGKPLYQSQATRQNSSPVTNGKISVQIHQPSSQRLSIPATNSNTARSDNSFKKIIWFGFHGADYGNFGMLNLLELVEPLTQVSQELSFSLLVVSNSYSKYCDYILPLPFKTDYIDWDPVNIYRHIAESDITIIPNSKSPFSICKSANRAILSLSLGVPVVATETPALFPFKDCTFLDDWKLDSDGI
jgi:hypothetical protein